MCYIPFVAFILFFVEKNVSKEYNTHMKYWMILFWGYILFSWILSAIFLWMFVWILALFYIFVSIYLWFKAYNWENIDIEILDNISDTIEDKMWKK
jgi:uncharacterized membrane protein